MDRILIEASKRDGRGKGVARALRREGFIPGVIYGYGESMAISLSKSSLHKLISHGHIESTLIDLKLTNVTDRPDRVAILRDYQIDPITGDLLHVDFLEVAMNEKITVTVPVELTDATPAGVKEGGILQFVVRDIEIECLPSQIPESIKVDASSLAIGDSLHVKDITPPQGIEILADPEEVILTILSPVTEERLEELLTTSKPAEETAEPEVIKKSKEKEESEGEK